MIYWNVKNPNRDRGFSIMELIVSLAIMCMTVGVVAFVSVQNQKSMVSTHSMSDAMMYGKLTLEHIGKMFISRSNGQHQACLISPSSNALSCNPLAAYCTCSCDQAGECAAMSINQRAPFDQPTGNRNYNIISTCVDNPRGLRNLKFRESCGLDCEKGRHPHVFIQAFEDGRLVWQRDYPSLAAGDGRMRQLIGSSFCATRTDNSGANPLRIADIQINNYYWNGTDSIVSPTTSRDVIPETLFANFNVIPVGQ